MMLHAIIWDMDKQASFDSLEQRIKGLVGRFSIKISAYLREAKGRAQTDLK